jgi:hypothetical protein
MREEKQIFKNLRNGLRFYGVRITKTSILTSNKQKMERLLFYK